MAEKALAFIDLLGFSQMINNNEGIAKRILSDFYNITYEIIRNEADIEGKMFSDSLLAISDKRATLVDACCKLYRTCLLKNEEYDWDKNKYFLLPRGGISIGIVDIQQRNESPNLSKDFIVSPALVHSAGIEKSIKGSRLLVAIKVNSNEERDLQWNSQISTLLYQNDAHTIWPGYKYCDALWFADTNKETCEQKREIESLIEIASQLLLASKEQKNIEQHCGTLRMGLLSYTRFFEASMSANYFSNLLNKFEDEKYWRIWIALFEMGLRSNDTFAFPYRPDIFEFYKRISITKGWIKVITELHKPYNQDLLTAFTAFLERLHQ